MRTKALLIAALLAAPIRQLHALAPEREAPARAAVRAAVELGPREGLSVRAAWTNLQGQRIVRFDHTFDGHRVYGSQAIAHVLPDGSKRVIAQGLVRGVGAVAEPTLDPERAIEFALARAAPHGAVQPRPPKVQQVLFPTQFTGGLSAKRDSNGRLVLDRQMVVHAIPAGPFVWAYQVDVFLKSAEDGPRELEMVVDARTGNILRVTDMLQGFTPVPSRGTGNGAYSGHVAIDTARLADGTYALYDTTRGTLPSPDLALITPDDSGWTSTGMQVWYEEHDASGRSLNYNYLFQANPTNSWGDGQPFSPSSFGHEGSSPNGQSVGVDALYATQASWDFFKAVLGRNGFDGEGTSAVVWTLLTEPPSIDWTYYSPGGNSLQLGAGSYSRGNPNGLGSLTDLDIIAHEWTHALTSQTRLYPAGGYEEGGITEGTCDFFAQMIKAWAAGPRGSTVPDTGADWQMGKGAGNGTPMRWINRPSKDGISPDGWYDGIKFRDSHSSSGPIARALYFLAQGASSNPSDDAYSPFLPGGMAGIGNDATLRIWFKTITERLIGTGNASLKFADARREAINAAIDLYPNDSTKGIAVENAFAAINVGDAHSAPPHTQVIFDQFRYGDWIDRNHQGPGSAWANRQAFPKNERVVPHVQVLNNANTAVTWSVGGPSMLDATVRQTIAYGGVIEPDGSWLTPNEMGWHSMTATSVADPKQFGENTAFLINVDMDQDLEQDALDMGGIAFSWYLASGITFAHSVFLAPWVDDADVAYFVDAYRATWPAK
jgi:Zn-dependent metalloprotease